MDTQEKLYKGFGFITKRAKDLYSLIDAIHGLKSEQGVSALMYYNEKAGDGYLALLEQLKMLDKKLHAKALKEAKEYGIIESNIE